MPGVSGRVSCLLRATLVNLQYAPGEVFSPNRRESLGIGYLAAVARANRLADVTTIDALLCGLTKSEVVSMVHNSNPDIVGISIPFQKGIPVGMDLAVTLKEILPNVFIVFGGLPISVVGRKVLQACGSIDAAVAGEGEIPFQDLLRSFGDDKALSKVPGLIWRNNGQIVENPTAPLIKDLDSLPFPARDHLSAAIRKGMRVASISSSRGCYNHCSFCSISTFYGLSKGPKWRARSAESVVEELAYVNREFGVTDFDFVDDNFMGPGRFGRQRALAIAEAILKKNLRITFTIACRATDVDVEVLRLLKRAGLRRVFLGVESGNQAVLDRFKKNVIVEQNRRAVEVIKELGLLLEVGFIAFEPDSSLEEVTDSYLELYRMLGHELDYVVGVSNKAVPFPGTPMCQSLERTERLSWHNWMPQYQFKDERVSWLDGYVRKYADQLDT